MGSGDLAALQSGFSLPTPVYLLGLLVFSILGFAAYRYGKKTERSSIKWIGVAMMLFPYATPETWQLYLVGGGLCGALYWFRR